MQKLSIVSIIEREKKNCPFGFSSSFSKVTIIILDNEEDIPRSPKNSITILPLIRFVCCRSVLQHVYIIIEHNHVKKKKKIDAIIS